MEASSVESKTSACMATYNGGRFVRQQLESILKQFEDVDEVIVVDDASSDNTVDIIRSLKDPRIKLIQNETNKGLARSFERSIIHATGDLIFLSDQDDIWRADKVGVFKKVSIAHPEVTLLISDANVINQEGKIIRESWFGTAGFHSGIMRNLIHNHYLGCAMAFRRSALKYCLPIPPRTPMNHDAWIGMLNQIFGRVKYIDEPLLSYRRHGSNVSPDSHAPLPRMLIWRIILMLGLAKRTVREIMSQESNSFQPLK